MNANDFQSEISNLCYYFICRPAVKSDKEFVIPFTDSPGKGVIAGVGSVESSFLVQTTPCPVGFNDPDLPAIMVYIQYLTQLEGPMWRQIRGLGLSYHYRYRYLNEKKNATVFLTFGPI